MKKIFLILIIGIFLIVGLGLASAEQQTLGTFKQNSCIQLTQTCGNCTYNNISFVYMTLDVILYNVSDQMSKVGTFYNYSFCNTSTIGEYNVHGFGDPDGTQTSWTYDFGITGTGFKFDQPRTILSLGLLGLLVFLFLVNVGTIPLLPKDDKMDDEGNLVSINKLKYVRPILWVTAWFLMIAIMFSGSNIALAYMGTTIVGNMLFTVFQVMMGLSTPMVVIWFVFIFYNIFQDKKMKEYTERGGIIE